MANTKSLNNVRASSNFGARNTNLGITGGNITIEIWANMSSQPATNANWGLVHHASTTNLNEEAIRYIDAAGTKRLQFTRSRSGVADLNIYYDVTLTTGTWYHIVLTYDGTNLLGFTAVQAGTHTQRASGTQSGAGSGFTNPDFIAIGTYVREANSGDSYATCIAQSLTTTSFPVDALIDDVRIWNTARTTANMDDNFQTELVGNESGLVAYYRFNDVLTDATSNAYDLTGNGSITYSTTIPFGAVSGPVNLKSYNTNLKANIKSIDTNLIANVKSFDTNV